MEGAPEKSPRRGDDPRKKKKKKKRKPRPDGAKASSSSSPAKGVSFSVDKVAAAVERVIEGGEAADFSALLAEAPVLFAEDSTAKTLRAVVERLEEARQETTSAELEDAWAKLNAATASVERAATAQSVVKRLQRHYRKLQSKLAPLLVSPCALENVWAEDASRRRVLVSGAPGSGKTSALKKIAHDWAVEPRLWRHRFDCVIFVRLEQSRSATSMRALLGAVLESDDATVEAFLSWTAANPDRTLWMIDGPSSAELSLENVNFLITTCAASPSFDATLHVQGLSLDSGRAFVKRFVGGDKAKYRAIRKAFKASEWLSYECHASPLLMKLVCEHIDQAKQFSSKTKIFQAVVDARLKGSRRWELGELAWTSFKGQKWRLDASQRPKDEAAAFFVDSGGYWKQPALQAFLAAEFVCSGNVRDVGHELDSVWWEQKGGASVFFAFVVGLGGAPQANVDTLRIWYPKSRLFHPDSGALLESGPISWLSEDSSGVVADFLRDDLWKSLLKDPRKCALLAAGAAREGSVAGVQFMAAAAKTNLAEARCLAASLGNVHLVRQITESTGDASAVHEGWSPVLLAVKHERLEVLTYLLKCQANLRAQTPTGKSALHLACERKNVEIIRLLLEGGIDVELADGQGTTPLMQCLRQGDADLLQLLLDAGADVDCAEKNMNRPLHVLAAQGGAEDLEMARKILERTKALNGVNLDNQTALTVALTSGHAEMAKLLKEAGGTEAAGEAPKKASKSKEKAKGKGKEEEEEEEEANPKGSAAPSALLSSVRTGDLAAVKACLALNTDVDASSEKETPLVAAAKWGDVEIVQLLLDHGASVNLHAPLVVAAQKGHLEIVSLLLQRGADVDIRVQDGSFPLLVAAREGHTQVVKCLIDHKAHVSATATDGRSPLTVAYAANKMPVVLALLQAGADISLLAVPATLVQVQCGLNRNLINNVNEQRSGLSAGHCAKWLGRQAISVQLEQLGCSCNDKEARNDLYAAFLAGKCTFEVSKELFHLQVLLTCQTCWPEGHDEAGVCVVCANHCHKGHELGPALFKRGFCHCSQTKCHSAALVKKQKSKGIGAFFKSPRKKK